MLRLALPLLASASACGFSINTGSSIDASADGSNPGPDATLDAIVDDAMIEIDAPIDAPPAQWTAPQILGFIGAEDPTLSGDLLQLWFEQSNNIFHATRANVLVPFGTATLVQELSTAMDETTPEVTTDGQTMMFARRTGNNDIFEATLGSGAWTNVSSVTGLNTTDHEQSPSLSDDRMMLAFTRNAPAGTADIYFSTRGSPSDPWSTPAPAIELNTNMQEGSVHLSGNKLTVCFDSTRTGAGDIYCATRASATVPFDTPFPLTEINSSQTDQDPWLSPDGRVLVFWSDRDGTGKLYFSIRL